MSFPSGTRRTAQHHRQNTQAEQRNEVTEHSNTMSSSGKRYTSMSSPRRDDVQRPRKVANMSSAQMNDIFFASKHRERPMPRIKKPETSALKLPETLKIPKSRIDKRSINEKRKDMTDRLEKTIAAYTSESGSASCPFCHDVFPDPVPAILRQTLDAILGTIDDNDDDNVELPASQESTSSDVVKVPRAERDRFCRLHYIELRVKSQGKAKGYPTEIEFHRLGDRVAKMEDELHNVITGKVPSMFWEYAMDAYRDLGSHKARNALGVLSRFERSLPGYYGARGAEVILDTLQRLFIHTNILTPELTHPQHPLEYAQQVLIPEAGWRLIRDDLAGQSVDQYDSQHLQQRAIEVMGASAEYGSLIYPAGDEPDIDIR